MVLCVCCVFCLPAGLLWVNNDILLKVSLHAADVCFCSTVSPTNVEFAAPGFTKNSQILEKFNAEGIEPTPTITDYY